MDRYIKQFIWGFQHHFRSGLETASARCFEQIGFGLGVRAYLVGFAELDGKEHPICFEPEKDPLATVDLSHVVEEGGRLYDENPLSQHFFSSGRHHERIHDHLADSMRGLALRRALEGHTWGEGRTFFVGNSAAIEGYRVYPILAVPRSRWESKPSLNRVQDEDDRYELVPSFQHSLMRELLRQATVDLGLRSPPEEFSLQWSGRSELIRKAAHEFVNSVSYQSHAYSMDLTVALNEVAAQPYEGRASAGGVLLATYDNPYVETAMHFVEPLPLSRTRSIRKALEMSTGSQHLLCDGNAIFGLGRLLPSYYAPDENAFVITVVGRGAWELSHAGTAFLRVTDTRPTLPEPRIDADRFRDVASRVFHEIRSDQIDRLWDLTETAAAAPHGTMLVVHRSAASEAIRLMPQAQLIQPRHLDPETLSAVTNIDGAVLVDLDGQCCAVGVILDGVATGTGDAGRGARYNSAIRYHHANGKSALVIIVSEDGMIDLLPNLNRRVTRSEVEEAVQALEAVISDDPDYEVFFRHHRHLEALAFYLSPEQCDRVNAARDALEAHRRANETLMLSGWLRFEPDPAMDDGYFIDPQLSE
ncbi:MAG: diadenylate cyclase [bacterium]|nr:diadenylate cyclase [bacterium]